MDLCDVQWCSGDDADPSWGGAAGGGGGGAGVAGWDAVVLRTSHWSGFVGGGLADRDFAVVICRETYSYELQM